MGEEIKPLQPPPQTPAENSPLTEAIIKQVTQCNDLNTIYELHARGRGLTHIRGLSACTKLRCLDLACNRIRRIEGLSANVDLRDIQLFGNRISGTLEPGSLSQCKELIKVFLHMNRIEAIAPRAFATQTKLKTLRLDHNRIKMLSLGGFDGCSASLTSLDLTNNPLSSLNGLPHLPKLIELRIGFTEISDVSEIPKHCPVLEELHLENTPVTDLRPLATLQRLQVLSLDACPILSLSPSAFRPMQSLYELRIRGCKGVADLSNVPALFPSLETLDASDCNISSIDSILSLASFRSLVELFLSGNPVSASDPSALAWKVLPVLVNLRVLSDVSVKRDTGLSSISLIPLPRPGTSSSISSHSLSPRPVSATSEPTTQSTSQSQIKTQKKQQQNDTDSVMPISEPTTGRPTTATRTRPNSVSAVPGPEIPISAPILAPSNTSDVLAARVMTPLEVKSLLTMNGMTNAVTERLASARKSLSSASQSRIGTPSKLAPIDPRLKPIQKRKEVSTPQQSPKSKQANQVVTTTITETRQTETSEKQTTKAITKKEPEVPKPTEAMPISQQNQQPELIVESVDCTESIEEDDRKAHKRGPPTSKEKDGYQKFRLPKHESARRSRPPPQIPSW